MVDNPLVRPDVTLTLDGEGVIRSAVSSQALEDEPLETWAGRPFGETIDLEISKMLEDIRRDGHSSCFQVRQRFPSGRELPMEYTAVSLGRGGGIIAIGKSLQMIADLQARLTAAQQAREQDYWKLREIETRYRLVFDASSEAAALVRTTNLRVVEANLAASKGLGIVPGAEFLPDLSGRERRAFETMLERVREQGRAPGIAVHLQGAATPWSLRATMATTQSDAFYLFQISPMGGAAPAVHPDAPSLEALVQRLPDGFVIVDREGQILRANHTFLDLAQVGAESAIMGQKLKRWLSRPGADISVILGMVQRHGSVRNMATQLEGDLGSLTEIEVSAVGDSNGPPHFVALLLRDVTPRLRSEGPARPAGLASSADAISLEALVRTSTEAIERSTIAEALERTRGHRTAAAKYLGLSRQSLHAKLKKYGFDEK